MKLNRHLDVNSISAWLSNGHRFIRGVQPKYDGTRALVLTMLAVLQVRLFCLFILLIGYPSLHYLSNMKWAVSAGIGCE